MNIFSEVKEQLTTRQVAESYGLRIRKNGVACCPFHDDRHPSMKVDKNWLDILCMGSEQEKKELFMQGRKEVEQVAGNVRKWSRCIMARCRESA